MTSLSELFGISDLSLTLVIWFQCQQQEVLEENRRMIPDCGRRLVTAWDELSKLVVCVVCLIAATLSEHSLCCMNMKCASYLETLQLCCLSG